MDFLSLVLASLLVATGILILLLINRSKMRIESLKTAIQHHEEIIRKIEENIEIRTALVHTLDALAACHNVVCIADKYCDVIPDLSVAIKEYLTIGATKIKETKDVVQELQ